MKREYIPAMEITFENTRKSDLMFPRIKLEQEETEGPADSEREINEVTSIQDIACDGRVPLLPLETDRKCEITTRFLSSVRHTHFYKRCTLEERRTD